MARALSAAFAGCGTTPTLSVPLSLAALDQLNGDVTDAALKRQRFRPHALSSLGMTDNGDVAWVKAQIRGQCGKVVGFEAFGLPLDGSLSGSRQPRPLLGPEVHGKLMNAVPPLKWNALLAGAAARHAGDMVRLNFRGHVNPTAAACFGAALCWCGGREHRLRTDHCTGGGAAAPDQSSALRELDGPALDPVRWSGEQRHGRHPVPDVLGAGLWDGAALSWSAPDKKKAAQRPP